MRGRRPALRVELNELPGFCAKLEAAGYRLHRGLRTTHEGELEAWVREIPDKRQCHVQIVAPKRGGAALVYAHTEPAGFTLRHLLAALTDSVSYQAGARVLRGDLERKGVNLCAMKTG